MKLELVDADAGNRPWTEPYLLRLPGWTWKRYLEEAPEMRFCEYVEGELVMHCPVGWDHQDLVRFLTYLLQGFCSARGLGRVGNGPAVIRVAPEKGREPDIFVIPPEQEARAHGMPLDIVPSLIVEVASPSTRAMDLEEKREEYRALGVAEYWVVDREQKRVTAHRAAEDYRPRACAQGRLASSAISGFWIQVEWLWRNPLPPEPECLREIEG
ncbi:MAG: Uma2 family endonuclease [Planctomycetes bacterium]|nr:Uma2 family endonuclease [Planctomycetota bacterium]